MNKLLVVLAAIAVLGGGWLVLIRDPGPDPLLDANRTLLAETYDEGKCVGEVFWSTGGRGGPSEVADCVGRRGSGERDLAVVQRGFCEGIVAKGYAGVADDCTEIMLNRRYWPTMDGTITDSWNRQFPYPGDLISAGAPDESRTGDRVNDNIRPEGDR